MTLRSAVVARRRPTECWKRASGDKHRLGHGLPRGEQHHRCRFRGLIFSGGISGSGSLAKLGSGTITLAASNGYTGGTTIGFGNGQSNVGGIVAISNGFALGTGSVTIIAGNPAGTDLGAQLQLSGNITVSNPKHHHWASAMGSMGALS